jgi:hypothetical protein
MYTFPMSAWTFDQSAEDYDGTLCQRVSRWLPPGSSAAVNGETTKWLGETARNFFATGCAIFLPLWWFSFLHYPWFQDVKYVKADLWRPRAQSFDRETPVNSLVSRTELVPTLSWRRESRVSLVKKMSGKSSSCSVRNRVFHTLPY